MVIQHSVALQVCFDSRGWRSDRLFFYFNYYHGQGISFSESLYFWFLVFWFFLRPRSFYGSAYLNTHHLKATGNQHQ